MANYDAQLLTNESRSPISSAVLSAATGDMPIRILLADEPGVFRDGLRALLSAQSDLQVVAEAADADSIQSLALNHKPDVLLFEPDGFGAALAVLRSLQEARVPAKVILLTSSNDSDLLAQAVRHGVAGIVPKKSPTEVLLKSIRKVYAGELWLDRATTAGMVRELTSKPIPAPRNVPQTDKPVPLSRREREIVGLVAQGFRNREIADKLFISEQTVKNHMHNIFEKIGVQDRLELALYAIYHRMYE
jgi:DNA-binding NarL/FixJ family response regulator